MLKRIVARLLAVCLIPCLLAGAAAPVAWAKEPATPEITLNQAISLALEHNEGVRKAERDIDRTEELKDYAADQLDYIPVSPIANAATEVAWNSFLTADLSWQVSKTSLTQAQDGLALDTCNKYWGVLRAQEAVKAAEVTQKSAQLQLRKVQAGARAGLVTQADLLAAQAGSKGAQAQLATTRNDLETAYTAFNQQVGLWPEDRPVLSDTVPFELLEIDNLDYEVASVLDVAPSVLMADQAVNLKKYQEDIMLYTSVLTGAASYKPYKARQIEVEQAELDAASVRKAMEKLTRDLYYGIRSLEEAYAGAQEMLKSAEENLRVARVKLEVGMITTSEVAAMEKDVADARFALLDLACQHGLLKLGFQKPWAYLSLNAEPSS